MEKKAHLKILTSAIFVFAFLAITPHFAHAATLYFSPSSGSYAVGSAVTANIYVSSADQAMNAASGVISFPQDKLEVISLSKTGSIFTLWVQEPSFSNSAGTVNFEGIVLNPGFTGSNGKAIAITFRTKAAGNALLTFSSGSVLANDGKGTNILTSLGNAQFRLGGAAVAPESVTPSETIGAPDAPEVSSPTHPDQNEWYAKEEAKFVWPAPSDVTGARLLVSKIPAEIPVITYAPAISEKEVTDLTDGIWYFHARLRNTRGWGATSHFRFQIDTQPPQPFSIQFIGGSETANPRPTALFDTTDALSDIDYYRVRIGEGDLFVLPSEIVKSNPYTLPFQALGKRTMLVQAFDKAGNYTAASSEFTILPPPSPLATTGLKITNLLSLLIPLVATFLLLIALLWYGWYRFLRLKGAIKKEVREAESALRKTFDLLKEDIRDQIEMLEKTRNKRQLTEEEKKVIKQLKKDLDDAEKFVWKELEDIEKEVK